MSEILQSIPSLKLTKPVLKGDDGGFYTPQVDEKGNLSWNASEDYMPALPSANIKGAKGDTGARGLQGIRGERGFQGEKGEQGIKGERGEPGLKGDKGEQGIQGKQGIQGLKGDRGEKGVKGDTGDITPEAKECLTAIRAERETVDAKTADTIKNAEAARVSAEEAKKSVDGMAIVDKIANPLDETAPFVSCYPVEGYPIDIITHIKPQQEEGEATPETPKAITEYTSARMTRCGKNLIPFPGTELRYQPGQDETIWGINFKVREDGSIAIKGTLNEISSGGKTLYYTLNKNLPIRPTRGLDTNYYPTVDGYTISGSKDKNVELWWETSGTVVIKIRNQVPIDTVIFPQMEIGKVATPYEPYNGTTLTADFKGQTVYGGEIDWKNKLVNPLYIYTIKKEDYKFASETEAYKSFSFEVFPHYDDEGAYKNRIFDFYSNKLTKTLGDVYAKVSTAGGDYWKGAIRVSVFIKKTKNINTLDECMEYLGNDTQIVLLEVDKRKVNPISITVSGECPVALGGENNIYSDCGDTQVKGRTNPAHEIEELRKAIISLGGNI